MQKKPAISKRVRMRVETQRPGAAQSLTVDIYRWLGLLTFTFEEIASEA